MRKTAMLPLAALLAFVFLGEVAQAYEINGVVYSSSGRGIPDVWVELLAGQGALSGGRSLQAAHPFCYLIISCRRRHAVRSFRRIGGSMRQLITLLLLVIVASAVCGNSLATMQTSNTIMGTVYDSDRRPIPDLWVEVLDEANAQLGRTRTDGVGRYSFSRLSTGIFLVRVASDGIHISQTQRVQIAPSAGASGSQIENVDFYLKSHSESTSTSPGARGTLFAQDVPDPARGAYEEGVQLLSTDLDGGMKKLNEAIGIFPDYYAALARYGFELVKSGKYDPAIAPLTKALQVNPKGQDSLFALGVAQYQLKRLPESTVTLTKMVDMAPESPNAPYARYYLGMALVKTGKPAEAEPQLRKAYEQGRREIPADVHMALAQIYGNSKHYKEAAAELELFLKETPDARDKEKIQALIKQLRAKAK